MYRYLTKFLKLTSMFSAIRIPDEYSLRDHTNKFEQDVRPPGTGDCLTTKPIRISSKATSSIRLGIPRVAFMIGI